jgi:Predicted membrane protein
MSETNPGKTTAIVAYITIVGCLIAITMNMEPKNAFARFHTRQAFGIHVLFHALAILLTYSGIVYLALPVYIFYFVLWIFGFLQVLNDKMKPLPVLGEYFQKWFTFIP